MVHTPDKLATGKVVWATDTDPITTEVGLDFHEIDPQAQRLLDEVVGVEL